MNDAAALQIAREKFEATYAAIFPTTVAVTYNKFALDDCGEYIDPCVFGAWAMFAAMESAQPDLNAIYAPAAELAHLAAGIEDDELNEQVLVQLRKIAKVLAAAPVQQPKEQPVVWTNQAAHTVLNMIGDGPYGGTDVADAIDFLNAAEIIRANIVTAQQPAVQDERCRHCGHQHPTSECLWEKQLQSQPQAAQPQGKEPTK